MASVIQTLSLTLFFAILLSARPTLSADSPDSSHSPSPQLPPEDSTSPTPAAPSPSPALPVSPPAPPPADLAPTPDSPAPSPDDAANKTAPSPAQDAAGDVSHDDQSDAGDLESESSGGMSGGKKAGVAIGVIGAACLVGLGALVYNKRQDNIRRSQYGYAARGQFL